MSEAKDPRPLAVVIVAGSMAAVKAPMVLRRLREAGFDTRALATRAALAFVTELSLATAADHPVLTDETWFAPSPQAQHLTLAHCDLLVVASASADLMARHAAGRADDLASATLLSSRAPVLWAPAMNPSMWEHPATQHNLRTLLEWGHEFIGPLFGPLGSSGEGEGFGRMAEPEQIAARARELWRERAVGQGSVQKTGQEPVQDLLGLHVVVSAGPTREYLDPVRFISNPSSGKMGFAVAERALARGARVTLVSGPVNLPAPPGARLVAVESALDMRTALLQAAASADIVVMTAAVADYRAAHPAGEKQAKTAQALTVELTPNPDILAELGQDKGERVLVGFAMETHAGVERAAQKARRKNADFILLNYPTREGTGFGGDDNEVTLVRASGDSEAWPRLSKTEVAERLLSEAASLHKYSRSV